MLQDHRVDPNLCPGGVVVHTYIDNQVTPFSERKIANGPMEAWFMSTFDKGAAQKVAKHTHETYIFDGDSGEFMAYQRSTRDEDGKWATVGVFMVASSDA